LQTQKPSPHLNPCFFKHQTHRHILQCCILQHLFSKTSCIKHWYGFASTFNSENYKDNNEIFQFHTALVFLHHIMKDINRGPKNKHHTEQPGEIPNTRQNLIKWMSTTAIFSKNKILFCVGVKRPIKFVGKIKRLKKYIKHVTTSWCLGHTSPPWHMAFKWANTIFCIAYLKIFYI